MFQQETGRRKSVCNWAELKATRTPRGNAAVTATTQAFVSTLPALVAAGHGLATLVFCLGFETAWIMEQVSNLGLPTPHGRPMRRPGGKSPWTTEQVQRVILLWEANLYATAIAEKLGRTPASVRYKAKWLGLPVRDRSKLVRTIPDAYLAPRQRAYAEWTIERDNQLGNRILQGQHVAGIAIDMGGTFRGIASRAGSIGLPARHDVGDFLKMDYDPKLPWIQKYIDEGWAHRPCNADPGKFFWRARNGDRTAPSTKKSKAYRDRLASGGNSVDADFGDY